MKCCLWDIETLEQRRIFTLIGENEAQVFEAAPFVTKGDILNQLETTKYQSSLKPLTLKNGVLFCLVL